MAYKISGTKNATARLMVFKESDWSIESNAVVSGSGAYAIENLVSGTKTVIAESTAGELLGYGNVTPISAASWLQYFDDSYWEPATGWGLPATGSWSTNKWVAEQSVIDPFWWWLVIRPIGTWSNGFRPTKIRTYFNLEEYVELRIYAIADLGGSPSIYYNDDYLEGTEGDMSWVSESNIGAYWICLPSTAPFEVTNIEFYGTPV